MTNEQQQAVAELREYWKRFEQLTSSESEVRKLEEAIITALEAAQRSLATARIMPGAWECPKCNFVLQKNTLHTGDGSVSADTSPLNEVCPNDGQLMKPLEWRTANEKFYELAKQAQRERDEAIAKLTEHRELITKTMNKAGELRAECEELRQVVNATLYLRCKAHYSVPQQNKNVFDGGECGACIAQARDEFLAERDACFSVMDSVIDTLGGGNRDGIYERAIRFVKERVELQAKLAQSEAAGAEMRRAVERNHKWHQETDDYDGYADSELGDINSHALGLSCGTAFLAERERHISALRLCLPKVRHDNELCFVVSEALKTP